jgi:hypothetical protein
MRKRAEATAQLQARMAARRTEHVQYRELMEAAARKAVAAALRNL